MTAYQAYEAATHAQEVEHECDGDVTELDRRARVRRSSRECPRHFTREQRDVAQRLLLNAYERAIGRA